METKHNNFVKHWIFEKKLYLKGGVVMNAQHMC